MKSHPPWGAFHRCDKVAMAYYLKIPMLSKSIKHNIELYFLSRSSANIFLCSQNVTSIKRAVGFIQNTRNKEQSGPKKGACHFTIV